VNTGDAARVHRLLVVLPGGTQTFDLPTLPAALPDQLASIAM
jgi:hypothetical protein